MPPITAPITAQALENQKLVLDQIDAVNATTDNLVIAGPSANISVTGRTGLRARDYDQQMVVVPRLGNSLPLVGAVVGVQPFGGEGLSGTGPKAGGPHSLIRFAAETGSKVVAEGVETEEELAVLRTLGVKKAQGYLLGRPAPLGAAS